MPTIHKESYADDKSKVDHLKSTELKEADNMWLLHVQRLNYPEVFSAIAKQKPNTCSANWDYTLITWGFLDVEAGWKTQR